MPLLKDLIRDTIPKGMNAAVFVVIPIAGVVERDKWIPGDIEQSSPQAVELSENHCARKPSGCRVIRSSSISPSTERKGTSPASGFLIAEGHNAGKQRLSPRSTEPLRLRVFL